MLDALARTWRWGCAETRDEAASTTEESKEADIRDNYCCNDGGMRHTRDTEAVVDSTGTPLLSRTDAMAASRSTASFANLFAFIVAVAVVEFDCRYPFCVLIQRSSVPLL